jgi:hypothetical protein
MTPDPSATLMIAIASAAAWLMMQAGLAKNVLELRRKRPACPSCGRHDRCTCSP